MAKDERQELPKEEFCRRCGEHRSKHLVVEDAADVLAPKILICPIATFDPKRWFDE